MNDGSQQRTASKVRWGRVIVNAIVCVAILIGVWFAIEFINRTEPVAEKVNTSRKSSALVDTITVSYDTYSPGLSVLGTVRPAQQINLRPRVGGQVIELSPKFVPGGMVKKGDLLLKIDPADFENDLSIKKSELEKVNASMEIEEARARLAKKELELLQGTIANTNRGLVLREPQIASMNAEVSAAKAAVDRSKLNLERTTIYAPFDAQVLSRSVNVGSQVSAANDLGQLVGLDEYWVMASVPIRSLRWVEFPEDGKVGSKVTLSNVTAWGDEVKRCLLYTSDAADE